MGNSNGKPVILTDEVNLNHFRLLRVVGKGAFGKVRIVERKDTGLTFALKYIRKDEVVRSESVRNIIRERRMLEHLNHPFLCNLRYSFQDVEYLYIVVDLMTGGDLRFHISRKTFTEEAVRFWIAELGCALRYIHQQSIVHRDVKPDNILLDVDGHVHLADFNVASELTPGRQLSSKSGTMAYLAPEVYQGKGYQSEVDWWSLGVTFYECIYNRRPFEAHHHEQLAQSIVRAMPPFHTTSPPVSNPCLHAISSLLEKDKTQRIGAAGFETFTDNPFFRAIDFEALERKEIDPVFCPSSDKTNFDATYDLEELLLEEAPLEARARKQKPRAELRDDATQQEIRAHELHKMIETMFEPFNYTQLPPERDRAPTTTANVGAADAASGATPATAGAASSSSTASSRSKKSLHSRTSPPGVDSGFSELGGSQQRARAKETHQKHHKHQSQSLQQQSQAQSQAQAQAQAQQAQQQQAQQPPSRSQTPQNLSRTRSSNHSADGSPPLLPSGLPQQDYFSPGNPSAGAGGAASAPSTPRPAGLPPQNPRARMLKQEEDAMPVANNNPSSPVTSALSITSAPDSSSSPPGGGGAANNSNAVAVGSGAPTSAPKSPPQNRLHKDQNNKHRSSPRSSSFGGSGRTSGMGIFQHQHIQQHVQVQQHVQQQVQQQQGTPLPPGGESEVVVIAGGPAAVKGQGQGQGQSGRNSGGDGSGGGGGGAGGGGEKGGSEKPTGMLGFLSRKKGRDRSPKGKEKERGVLGKEGARVIVH